MLRHLIVAAIVFAALPAHVRAQHAHSRLDQISLARVVASEGGLQATDDEVAAIGTVLRSRCSRCSLTTVARQYSRRVFDASRRDPRAWLAFLRADGRQPEHWPSGVSWATARERWMRIYEAAGRFVRGELEHRCEGGTVDHWGSPRAGSIDMRRARRAGWTRVDCGDTRNAFWRVHQ
jgi:hypothetical protein